MKTYQATFNANGCNVSVPVSAENENKAYRLATLICIESNGDAKTVKLLHKFKNYQPITTSEYADNLCLAVEDFKK